MEKIIFTKGQESLIRLYCERAKLPPALVKERIIEGKTTISEVKAGILGLAAPKDYLESNSP